MAGGTHACCGFYRLRACFAYFAKGMARRRRNPYLTLPNNPQPYGCGLPGHNICGFVGSNPPGDDRAALPWACVCASVDGTVCALAADDFKTYCLPGAGADCGQDQAWTREYLHTEASG